MWLKPGNDFWCYGLTCSDRSSTFHGIMSIIINKANAIFISYHLVTAVNSLIINQGLGTNLKTYTQLAGYSSSCQCIFHIMLTGLPECECYPIYFKTDL